MDGFDEVIKEFLVESYESLDQLDGDLLALEDQPDDRDRLASIFRTIHTIKGTSGFLALPKLERVAHVGENLLVPLRDGVMELDGEIADGLLAMVDAIRDILSRLEADGTEGDDDFEPLVAQLKTLLEGGTSEAAANSEPQGETTSEESETKEEPDTGADFEILNPVEVADVVDKVEEPEEAAAAAATDPTDTPAESDGEQPAEPAPASSGPEQASNEHDPTESQAEENAATGQEETKAEQTDESSNESTPPAAAETPPPAVAPPAPSKPPAKKKRKSDSGERSNSVADSTVRIDVELLDRLMNLVGELVLSRNQILQFCSETDDAAMIAASQRLNLITTELQEEVMKTRMQPIRNAWSKLPRVVRDLSTTCGKRVEVRMEGADTELDKTILEAIKDPLTHIVRNSVDHGIEPSEVREANGKPPVGTLLLRAFHESGQVNIEISDDGGGISSDRIRDKAISKGLLTEEQAEEMTDRELTNLILLPGFSTAEKVTNVSGRGVGMDVVKTNIERIGGSLDIQSTQGKGTTLRIKIPLTLAIVPALIVRTEGDFYAIPQVSLLEVVRLEGPNVADEIEFIHDFPVYRLREQLLPLVYLDEQLGLRPRRMRGDASESITIVVLQAEDRQFGLVVDAVTDTQEIVVKPLSNHLKNISAYAGGTIMGDGTVALILDVIGLAQKSSVLAENRDKMLKDKTGLESHFDRDSEGLLIVDTNQDSRAAIRLSTVARLEEFQMSQIERAGQHHVVQYRGEILPLVALSGSFGASATGSGDEALNAVVYASGEQRIGVIVGRIVDIVQEKRLDKQFTGNRIIHDRVTEVVDLEQLLRQHFPAASDGWSAA